MTESLRLIKFNKEPEKPKKENEDLQLEFKETKEDESPTDSKKFIHYENEEKLKAERIKILIKEAEDIYEKMKPSIDISKSKEDFIKKYIEHKTEGFPFKE